MLAEKVGLFVSTDWQMMFIDFLSSSGRSERTIQAYLQDVRSFASWFELQNGEPFDITLLNGVDLRQWRQVSLRDEKVSPATWNRRLASLRVLVGWAVETGAISYDPLGGVIRAEEVELAPRWLEHAQLVKLLRQCEINFLGAKSDAWRFMALRDQAMVVSDGVCRVARRRKWRGLTWRTWSSTRGSGKVIIRLGKGQKRREVPLAMEARRALRLWLQVRGEAGSALFVGSKEAWSGSARGRSSAGWRKSGGRLV